MVDILLSVAAGIDLEVLLLDVKCDFRCREMRRNAHIELPRQDPRAGDASEKEGSRIRLRGEGCTLELGGTMNEMDKFHLSATHRSSGTSFGPFVCSCT